MVCFCWCVPVWIRFLRVQRAVNCSVANAAGSWSKLLTIQYASATYQTTLKNMVVYGDETTGVKPIVPGLTTSNVTVTANPT